MGGGVIGKGGKAYSGELTSYAFGTCIVAAAAGLIFGYDIGISGGVTSMPIFLKKFFPSVYRKEVLNVEGTNQYCKFDDAYLTLFTSSLYLAGLVASVFASKITRRFGRKCSMILGGLSFLAGACLNGAAQNLYMLIGGRVLLGVGIGFGNQSAPVFLSEMAPYKYRGACNMLFQLSITIGILVATILNYFTAKMDSDWGWRTSLGLAGVPALIFIVGSICLPDTPNSMIERGQHEEARARLIKIRGTKEVDEEFNDMVEASIASKKITNPWGNLFKRKYRPHLTLVTCIPFFQQLTGMNVFMFYAPVLFKTIGFGDNASLMSAVISNGVNAVATFVSILSVDKIGRKTLFIEGGVQMFLCQLVITTMIAIKFGTNGNPGVLTKSYAGTIVTAICVYIAGFAWSWGPLGWLVPAEILPLEIRSAGQSMNVCVNMLFTFFIAEIFMKMMCTLKFGLFIFFSFFVCLMTGFVIYYVPETKGIPIEDMQGIWKAHWYWKRFVKDEEIDQEKVTVEIADEKLSKA